MTSMTKETAQPKVDGTDQTNNCSLTSLMPSIRLTTQNKLSLKYEKIIAPKTAACAAKTKFTSKLTRIGAEIETPVIIATVPLPCIKRTIVAMKNGTNIAGMGQPAICSAI